MQAQESLPALHRGIEGYEGAIVRAYAPMRVSSASRGERHRWAVEDAPCGELRVTRIFAEGAIRAYIPRDPAPVSDGQVLLTYVERGAFQFEQAGQSAECAAGSMVLMDASHPLRAEQSGLAQLLSIVFPAPRLRAEASHLEQRCTVPVQVTPGTPSVLRDLMQCAWRERKALSREGTTPLPKLFGKLIEAVFPDQPGHRRGTRQAHLPAVREIIRSELRNPQLSPRLIAARLGLSTSYLFSLAREAGTSVHEAIIEARLEACREALSAPAWSSATITEIALEFGFQDPTHFSKRFRARFGRPPSSMRVSPGGLMKMSLS